MQSGERDHPLRHDPLHHLPDAVTVPRRQRTYSHRRPNFNTTAETLTQPHVSPATSSTFNSFQPSNADVDAAAVEIAALPPLPTLLAPTQHDIRVVREDALRRFAGKQPPTDPLLAAVLETATPPPAPPAGEAYASDVDALLARAGVTTNRNLDNQLALYDDDHTGRGTPVAAGVVHRSDVAVLPVTSVQGAAAGVYAVRSRRYDARPFAAATLSPTAASSASAAKASACACASPPDADGGGGGSGGSAGHAPAVNGSGPAAVVPSSLLQSPPQVFHLVRRSLADFSWLEQRLSAKYDGIIVPSLPEMTLAGRLAHGYAHDAERRRGLQRFLQRVATHPVLATSDEVLSFVGVSGEDAWRKLRREPIIATMSVTDLLFARGGGWGDGRNGGGGGSGVGPLVNVGAWGERLLWQTGKRLNRGLVWFLERDRAPEGGHKTAVAADSAQAKLERLQKYVQDLTVSLGAVREASGRVARSRSQEREGVWVLQEAVRRMAEREGGKFGAQFEAVVLDIGSEGGGVTRRAAGPRGKRGRVGGEGVSGTDGRGDNGTVDEGAVDGDGDGDAGGGGADGGFEGGSGGGRQLVGVGSVMAARMLDEVLRDFEERAKGAQRIMAARQEEHEAYERALSIYKKLRDRLERQADSMWDAGVAQGGYGGGGREGTGGLEELGKEVSGAAARLAVVRRHYQAVAVRTTDELRRLRVDMHEDVCEALERLGRELVKEHEAHAQAWADVVRLLGDYASGLDVD